MICCCFSHCSEQGNEEAQLAEALSPVSKKKTGHAYVALAQAHSDKFVTNYFIAKLSAFIQSWSTGVICR